MGGYDRNNAARSAAWRKAHPERIRAYAQAYRKAHADRERERHQTWCHDHPERVRELAARWMPVGIHTPGHPVFTPDQVVTIRRALADGVSRKTLAVAYRVSYFTIRRIDRGETYRDVTGEPATPLNE